MLTAYLASPAVQMLLSLGKPMLPNPAAAAAELQIIYFLKIIEFAHDRNLVSYKHTSDPYVAPAISPRNLRHDLAPVY